MQFFRQWFVTPSTTHRFHMFAAVSASVLLLGACIAPPVDDDETGCGALVAAANQAVEPIEQVRQLDLAMAECDSRSALVDELRAYPHLIGYSPDDFITLRCTSSADTNVTSSSICGLTVAVTTAPPAPPSTLPQSYAAATVDGRNITLRPTDEIQFVDGVPVEIAATVDRWFTRGCEGLIARRDELLSGVTDDRTTDPISVYAQHADNLVDLKGC